MPNATVFQRVTYRYTNVKSWPHYSFSSIYAQLNGVCLVMPRQSSCRCCWNPLVSSGGMYPCVLYKFTLGNRQQSLGILLCGIIVVSRKRAHECYTLLCAQTGQGVGGYFVTSLHLKLRLCQQKKNT